MEVKVWNAILGNVVKYKALDIFKYFNAFPTSLKAKLCISAMRLLLKSILEMLGIWLNALRSEKANKRGFFFKGHIFAIYHGWTLYLPISTKLALTKFSSSNPGAKGLNWLSVTRPWYRIPGNPTFRMFRIKPTSRRGTNPMSSPDKDKSFKENLNPINDAFGDTLNMLSLSLRLLIISKSSKRVSGKSFSLKKKL